MRPCSTSRMTAVVVATTLVNDARSKIVSVVVGCGRGDDGALPVGFLEQDDVAPADQHDHQAFARP